MVKPLHRYTWAVTALLFFISFCSAAGTTRNLSLEMSGKENSHAKSYFDDIIAVSGPLCQGSTATLTLTNPPAGAITWFKNNTPITGQNGTSLIINDQGNYYATAGTVTYTTVSITFAAKPTAHFTFTGDNQCMGQGVNFTDQSTGALTYKWDFGDPNSGSSNTSTLQNPTHNFVGSFGGNNQIFTVKLTVTNASGCSDTYSTTVTSKQLSDPKLGGLSPVTYNGATYFRACGSGATQMTFVNQSTTNSSNALYHIDWGDGSTPFDSPTFTSTPHNYAVGTWQITYTVTSSNGCVNTSTYYVFVGSTPSGTIDAPANASICTSNALTFNISNTAGNTPGTTYQIIFSDGSPTLNYTNATIPTTVTHTFNSSSCGKTAGTYSNAFSATLIATNPCSPHTSIAYPIYVSQAPQAAFTASKSTACVGQTVSLKNTSLGNEVSPTGCDNAPIVWSVSPATGWTKSGTLGDDFGQTVTSLWSTGSDNVDLTFTATGTYTIKLKIGNSCSSDIITKTVCVNPVPTASFTIDKNLGCNPLVVNTTNTSPAPNCGTNTYQWSVNPSTGINYTNGTSSTSATPQFTFTSAGIYTIGLITTSPGGCSSTVATQTVTINTVPSVTLPSTSSVCEGGMLSPSATVNASGSPTYSWTFQGGAPASSTALIPGTITYASAGTYTTTLSVTNDCGTTTKSTTVIVNSVPVVTVPADKEFCSGNASGTLNFSSTVTGTTYHWTNSNPAIGLATSGNTPSISFTAASVSTAQTATITVTPSAGGCSGTPKSFTITVYPQPAPPGVSAGPVYCVGAASNALTATATGSNTLNWYSNAALTVPIAGTPTPSTASAGATTYYVTQTNGHCESMASSITVSVNIGISGNTIGNDQTICLGGNAQQLKGFVTLSGGTGSYTYQWQASTDNSNWAPVNGATLATYTPNSLTVPTYFRRIVNSGSCSDASSPVKIDVQGSLTNINISSNQTICSGNAPNAIIGDSPTGGNGTFTYQWESSTNNNNWTPIGGATSKDYTPGTLSATTYYHRITTSGSCVATSNAVTITVNPLPVVNAIINHVVCLSSATSPITFSSSTSGASFAWSNDNSTIGLATSGTGDLPSFNPVNTTHSPVSATITVRASTNNGANCDGPTTTFKITILPNISIDPLTAQSACAGTPVTAVIPNPDAAAYPGSSVSYSWSVNNTAIGLTSGNGSQVPSFTATNTTTVPISATIMVTPVYHLGSVTCNGSSQSYTVTVQPLATIANAGADAKTCQTSYQLAGNTPTVGSGQWSVSPAGPSFDDITKPTAIVNNLTKGTRYTFTWKISNGACASSSDDVVLDVLTDISNTISASVPAVCPGSASVLSGPVSGGDVPGNLNSNYAYSWESSTDNITWTTINSATGSSYNATPSVTTWYRRLISSYSLCPKTSAQVQVIVNAVTPTANAGTNQELCNQTSTQLHGSSLGSGFTGTWSDLNPASTLSFVDVHDPNTVVNGLQAGNTYIFQWIVNGSCGITYASVKINDYTSISNTISAANATVCYGVALNVGGQPTGGNGVYSYTWQYSPDGTTWTTVGGQAGREFTGTLTQSGKLKRIVSSVACQQESNVVDITVQPAIANNSITGITSICTGLSPGQITGSTPTGGDGSYLYQWQSSSDNQNWSNINGADQINYSVPVLTQSTYYRRIVRTALCSGAQESASTSMNIIVRPDAKAEFTASAVSHCAPFNLGSVISLVSHPDRNSDYEWFADGASIGHGTTFPGYNIATANRQVTIRLVTTSLYGCKQDTKEVIFSTVPTVAASFSKSVSSGCGPLTVHINNTSTPINAGTYFWDFGNGQTSNLQQPGDVVFLPHPLNRDTTYIIKLKATTSCSIDTYTDSVKVRPLPKAIFTPDKTTGCSPFTINVTNQSRGIPNTYTFDFGDGHKLTKSDNSPVQYTYTTFKTDTVTLKLVAENECGKDSTSYDVIIYPNTVQANLAVSGNQLSGCVPLTVKFDNNSTGANTFNWTFGDGNTASTYSAPESLSHTFTSPGTYTVKLMASNGCSNASTTQTITVYPAISPGFSSDKLQYCAKDTARFNNLSMASFYSYHWDFGDGQTSNDAQPKHAYALVGKYDVKLTVTRAYPDGSACNADITHQVEVLALPTAAFTSNAGALNCAPFTLTVTAASGPTNFAWDFNDPTGIDNQVNGTKVQHVFTRPGLYRVKMAAYNVTGCLDSTFQLVKVTETPVAAFSPGDTVLCGNSASIHLTNQSIYGGNDLVTYRWLINDAQVSTSKNLDYLFTLPSAAIYPYTFTVKLITSSTIGCSSTVIHSIKFNALPKAAFSVNMAGCAPLKALITNTSAHADIYKWYFNNKLVSTDKMPVNVVFPQSDQVYKLKLVVGNIYGCLQDSVEKTITTYPKPTALFALKDSVSCNGKLDIQIINQSLGATSYQWDFGDGSMGSSDAVPSHLYGIAGIYKLRLFAFNGYCRDTVTHLIQIASTPKAVFTADPVKGCTVVNVHFTNSSLNADTYAWDFGDGTFSTQRDPIHAFTYTKSPYTVKLIAYGQFGCSDTTVMKNYISVSAPPKADFTVLPDSVIKIPAHTFNFKNQSSSDAISWKWDFGDHQLATAENPSHSYVDTGTYKVTLLITNKDGCLDTAVHQLRVASVPQYLYVPNAFEPGNGKAELKTFTVRATGLASYNLKIFNKWGEMIWQTIKLDVNGAPMEGWDGSMHGVLAPQGAYIWTISAKYLDGTEWKGMKYKSGPTTKTGTFYLMR